MGSRSLVLLSSLLWHYVSGTESAAFTEVIVHLFEWKWSDIALECERFLGSHGYTSVQISPPSEHILVWTTDWDHRIRRPWWERYQPVSYRIASRSGDRLQFVNMVKRCHKAGVRIYVDAVINHMTFSWEESFGTAGGAYNGLEERYPWANYNRSHFNDKRCKTKSGNIDDFSDIEQVRDCKLMGLNDLNHHDPHVALKISQYLKRLMSLGVDGFRIDAAKHIWPNQLRRILKTVYGKPYVSGQIILPFVYQEVKDMDVGSRVAREYLHIGAVTEFKFGSFLTSCFRKRISLKYLKNFGKAWDMLPSNKSVVFIDNHDTQRDFGAVLTFREPRLYKMAVAFMLSWKYGIPVIMSSYEWKVNIVNGNDVNGWIGPPQDDQYRIQNVTIFDDLSCGKGRICEHRWRQIYNMVEFRKLTSGEKVTRFRVYGDNQISFCRGNKGFVAFNNDDFNLKKQMQVMRRLRAVERGFCISSTKTCLPAGSYCDVISGSKVSGRCTGRTLQVQESGLANVEIQKSGEDGVLAIHVGSRL